MAPGITIPSNARDVTINANGEVQVKIDGQTAPNTVGTIQLAAFPNEAGRPLARRFFSLVHAAPLFCNRVAAPCLTAKRPAGGRDTAPSISLIVSIYANNLNSFA